MVNNPQEVDEGTDEGRLVCHNVLMRSLEEINHDLARVTDELIATDDADYPRRYELLKQQDALRHEAQRFHSDAQQQRTASEIRAELEEVRRQRDKELRRVTGFNMMSGPGGTGGASAAVSREMTKLTSTVKTNSRLDALNGQIARLESILASKQDHPD